MKIALVLIALATIACGVLAYRLYWAVRSGLAMLTMLAPRSIEKR